MVKISKKTKPVWINNSSPLFAIQHEPDVVPDSDSSVREVNKTGVIILSSGFLHNVGPYRLNVDIANSLSQSGFTVLRVDQSGKGDSPARLDVAGLDAKLADYDDLFNYMQSNFGITNVVLIGLCSGADDGLDIANVRDTVSGLVFLDGFAPVSFWYHFHHYFTRLRHFRSWRRWKQKVSEQQKLQVNHQSGDVQHSTTNVEYNTGMSLRRWQSEDKVKRIYESTLKRGCNVLAVFTGSTADYYNHQGQLKSGLRHSSKILHEKYFPQATHIYSNAIHRKALVDLIVDWSVSVFSHN